MASSERHRIYRHPALVRLTHWMNAVCVVVLLMSGLQIFNAHPALYWGDVSHFDTPLAAVTAEEGPAGQPIGVTTLFGSRFVTTGVLGVSAGPEGTILERGFPSWATLPGTQDLAIGRRWHFFFAWLFAVNGAAYLAYTLLSGRARRDLAPSRDQLRHIGRSIRDHLRFRFPAGEEARHYNVLQKLAYIAVAFLLLPLMVVAGLAMSPGMDAAFPGLLTALGGRQAARTIHFVAAWAIVLFVLVHVFMVLVSGVWNNLRSMITGWYAIEPEGKSHDG